MSADAGAAEKLMLAAVKQALLYAHAAVASDEKQDYVTAHKNYRQVVTILGAQPTPLALEDQQLYADKILAYQRRMELIEQVHPSLAAQNVAVASIGKADQFKEETIADAPFPDELPEEQWRRPYWLMRTLLKTMTTGGFLTPRVYIPRSVWFQQGVKLDAVQVKLGTCYPVLESLQRLGQIKADDGPAVAAELEAFVEKLFVLQNTLSQHLSFVVKVSSKDEKLQKQMKKVMLKGAEALTVADRHDIYSYVSSLTNVFKEAQFLESWAMHWSKTKSPQQTGIMLMLGAVGDYFGGALCAFVLKDLAVLLEKYLKLGLEHHTQMK